MVGAQMPRCLQCCPFADAGQDIGEGRLIPGGVMDVGRGDGPQAEFVGQRGQGAGQRTVVRQVVAGQLDPEVVAEEVA